MGKYYRRWVQMKTEEEDLEMLIEVQGDDIRLLKKKLQDQAEIIEKQSELLAEQTRMSQILSKETL